MIEGSDSIPNTLTKEKKRQVYWRWLALILTLTPLTIFGLFAAPIFGFEWHNVYHAIYSSIEEMGWMGQLAIIGLMIVHCFIPFPAEFVAIAAGSAYGPVIGTALTWSGAMLGAILSFGLTRLLGQPFVDWALPEKQRRFLDQWTSDQGAMTLLVSRFIPVIAFNLINYAAGLTKISWWTFIWTTGVGIFPLTAAMVYMGSEMHRLSWTVLVIVSVICIGIMGLLHWIRRRNSRI